VQFVIFDFYQLLIEFFYLFLQIQLELLEDGKLLGSHGFSLHLWGFEKRINANTVRFQVIQIIRVNLLEGEFDYILNSIIFVLVKLTRSIISIWQSCHSHNCWFSQIGPILSLND
jgi:hypothetical protein